MKDCWVENPNCLHLVKTDLQTVKTRKCHKHWKIIAVQKNWKECFHNAQCQNYKSAGVQEKLKKRWCRLIWGVTFQCKKHLHETWKCKQHYKCRLVFDGKYLMRSCLISWNKVDWQEGHCMNTLMLSNLSGPTNNHPGLRKYFPLQMKLSSWTSVGCYLKLERGTSSHPWRSIWTNFHIFVMQYWSWLDSQIWI